MTETTRTITLDAPTRAFMQGVTDGAELAETCPDRETWLFFAGRAFGLRYGNDQASTEAQSYVRGLNTRKPNVLAVHSDNPADRRPRPLDVELQERTR